MKQKALPIASACLLFLISFSSVTSAEYDAVPYAAPVGTGFTYQGYLEDGGLPANADYDLRFRLYDASVSGSQIGPLVALEDFPIVDGQFTVALDFGDVFDGTASWLQIDVRPWDSGGLYTELSPRQELTAVPYAHYARNIPLAGSGAASTAARSDHEHWGTAWTGSGDGLTLTSVDASALVGSSSVDGGAGVWGSTTFSSTWWVWPPAAGVIGEATNPASNAVGVAGIGPQQGVIGYATQSYGSGIYGSGHQGVYGRSDTTFGRGVYGISYGDEGEGIYGEAEASNGTGVYGYASSTTGFTRGTEGVSDSTQGRGVYGRATSATGEAFGVAGQTESNAGRGVYGVATSTGSGTTYGVYGTSMSAGGHGVYGYASSTTGTTYGVYGYARSPGGYGGFFRNTNASGMILAAVGASPSDLEFKVDYDGDVYADRAFHCGVNDGGSATYVDENTGCMYDNSPADFAEVLPVSQTPEPGDVLVIALDGKLMPSNEGYQSNVVGVSSSRPSYVGGAANIDKEGFAPVAIMGVVPVKVSAENGAILPGDLLVTSDTPGHAMRAGEEPRVGTVIGKALEALEDGTGMILMLVMLQ